jgi:hypothetical protein
MNSQNETEAPQRETDRPQHNEWSEQQTVHTPVLSTENARQGATGHNVRYMLGFGLGAIVLAFVVIYLFYFA